ncbi:MAG: hypothetical protein H6765_01495 [Candidatus Peribacteria bacterium]|nr:MAG: hypothetical protein H6765_01495 [Candidatus Peribacteria bacterium]
MVQTIADFLPSLIVAILVWVLAWFVARIIKLGVHIVLKKMHLDTMSKKVGIENFLKNANFAGGLSLIIADIIFWLFYLFGINVAFNILGLDVISNLISDLIQYIPNLFVAVLIMIVGMFVAKFVRDLVDAAIATAKMEGKWISHVAYVIIMLFAIFSALKQAKVDISFLEENINTIVMGLMLAIGLAFGLGGKDKAKELIDKYVK